MESIRRLNKDFRKLPEEFDLLSLNAGFTMKGWNFSRAEIAEAINDHRMLNPAIELGTNVCPWNCAFCFTEDPKNPSKRRLSNEMNLEQRLRLIGEAADLGARTINFVGAGEPTIDPDFWTLIQEMNRRNIQPIIYTEGTLRLLQVDFASRLFDSGATVVLKVNSLVNEEYQNAIVRGNGRNKNASMYTARRNQVIDLLLKLGFADSNPTRLAFDTILTCQNAEEVYDIHRFARQNNIFVLFVGYLPSGRSSDGISDALSRSEQFHIFDQLAQIDKREFDLTHASIYPYAGGVPCSIRGTGLFIKITGSVFDCPGELISLGNFKTETLTEIWQRARPITQNFDGKCAPREAFWKSHQVQLTRNPVASSSLGAKLPFNNLSANPTAGL